jgi:hypothetical protein
MHARCSRASGIHILGYGFNARSHSAVALAQAVAAIASWVPSCVIALRLRESAPGGARRGVVAAVPLIVMVGMLAASALLAHAEQSAWRLAMSR